MWCGVQMNLEQQKHNFVVRKNLGCVRKSCTKDHWSIGQGILPWCIHSVGMCGPYLCIALRNPYNVMHNAEETSASPTQYFARKTRRP